MCLNILSLKLVIDLQLTTWITVHQHELQTIWCRHGAGQCWAVLDSAGQCHHSDDHINLQLLMQEQEQELATMDREGRGRGEGGDTKLKTFRKILSGFRLNILQGNIL